MWGGSGAGILGMERESPKEDFGMGGWVGFAPPGDLVGRGGWGGEDAGIFVGP